MSDFQFNQLTQPTKYSKPKPPTGFNPAIAYTLGLACNLTYTQYAKYPTTLPKSGKLQNGVTYKMIGNPFVVSESIGTSTVVGQSGGYRAVPAGFVMQCTAGRSKYNVVAIRGTQTFAEWMKDADIIPTGYMIGDNGGKGYEKGWTGFYTLGTVHGGFYNFYTQGKNGALPVKSKVKKDYYKYSRPSGSIAAGISAALNDTKFDKSLPLYVTGHSLGAGIAVLCALDIGTNFKSYFKSNNLFMYNLAGPPVAAGLIMDGIGVPNFDNPGLFKTSFNNVVKNSFRIVNAADIVPISPPSSLSVGYVQFDFEHVTPNNITFCAQTGSIGGNHSCSDTYVPYLQQLSGGFATKTTTVKKKVKAKIKSKLKRVARRKLNLK